MKEASYQAALKRLDQEPDYMNSADYRTYAIKKTERKLIVDEFGLNSN